MKPETLTDLDCDLPLVSFLYTLMRDHLPAGVVQELYEDSANHGLDNTDYDGIDTIHFTNGDLANYALELANGLAARPVKCSLPHVTHEFKDKLAVKVLDHHAHLQFTLASGRTWTRIMGPEDTQLVELKMKVTEW